MKLIKKYIDKASEYLVRIETHLYRFDERYVFFLLLLLSSIFVLFRFDGSGYLSALENVFNTSGVYTGYDNEYLNGVLFDSALIHNPRFYVFWENLKNWNILEYNHFIGTGVVFYIFPFGEILLNLPMLFFDQIVAMNLTLILMLTLASYFMYKLLRYYDLNNQVAILGSVAWGFSTHHSVWLNFPQHLATGMWIPLIFLLLSKILFEEVVRLKNYFYYFAILFLAINSGYPQVIIYILISLCVFTIGYIIYDFYRKTFEIKKYFLILLFTILSISMSYQFLGRMYSDIQTGLRGNQDRKVATECLICDAKGFIQQNMGFVSPDIFGNGAESEYRGPINSVEYARYSSLIFLPLLLLSFRRVKRKEDLVPYIGIITIVLFYCAMNGVKPIASLWARLPIVGLGNQYRIIAILNFWIVFVGTLNLEWLFNKMKSLKLSKLLTNASIFIIFGLVLLSLTLLFDSNEVVSIKISGLIYSLAISKVLLKHLIIYIGISVALYIYIKGDTKYYAVPLILMAFMELFLFTSSFNEVSPKEIFYPKFNGQEYIVNDEDYFRVFVSKGSFNFFPSNVLSVYGIEELGGYAPTLPSKYIDLFKDTLDNELITGNGIIWANDLESNLFSISNVKYVILETRGLHVHELSEDNLDLKISELGYKIVHEDTNYLILERIDFYKRVYTVDQVLAGELSDEKDDGFDYDPREYVYVDSIDDSIERSSKVRGEISDIVVYSESIEFDIDDDDGEWIFISQHYDKNWEATINNSRLEVFRSNEAFMAIYVPSELLEDGKNHVDMNYRDNTVYNVQIAITIGLLAMILSYIVLCKKRDEKVSIALVVVLLTLLLVNGSYLFINKEVDIKCLRSHTQEVC